MKRTFIIIAVLTAVGIVSYYYVINKKSSGEINRYTLPTTDDSEVNVPQTYATGNTAVNIKDFSFNPLTLSVKAGTKVTWFNNDSVPHTITSDSGNLLNSPTISPGQFFSFTFANPVSANYHCNIHPTMKGSVVAD